MLLHSWIFTIPYFIIVVFLLSLFFLFEYKKSSKEHLRKAEVLALIILLLFMGLRGHIYTDYWAYYPFFEHLPTITELSYDGLYGSENEFGFMVYSSIVKTLFDDYFVWVFINTLIDLIVLRYFFKKYSPSLLLSLIFFVIYNGLSMEFNLYRNMKSIGLFLISIRYIKNRKFLPFFALNLLGCTFHLSSFFFFPLYFFLHKRIHLFVIISLFVSLNILFFADIHFTDYLVQQFASFMNIDMLAAKTLFRLNDVQHIKITFSYLEMSITFLLLISQYQWFCKRKSANVIFFNMYFVFYFTTFFLYDIAVFADRVGCLFIPSIWILFPLILKEASYKIRHYSCLFFLLVGGYKIYTYNNNFTAKYDNLLWGIDSYETRRAQFEAHFDDLNK